MTAFTFGAAAGRVLTRLAPPKPGGRTGATPVRPGSTEAGTFEAAFFVAPAKGETDRLLRTARTALDAGKKARRAARATGRALTAAEALAASLTASAVRVLEELLTLARLNRGRVYPSYDRLATVTGLGRATVARALAILERVGFLVRRRRFTRVVEEGAGPRYAQTSNAYRATLPRRLLDLLPRSLRPAPVPDDHAQREADRAGEAAAMLAGLSCRELAEVTVGGALGQMLARLGAAIDRVPEVAGRESHDGPQTLRHDYNPRAACA